MGFVTVFCPLRTTGAAELVVQTGESEVRLWVAGCRIKVVPGRLLSASTLTRRPAPGFLPLGFHARRIASRGEISHEVYSDAQSKARNSSAKSEDAFAPARIFSSKVPLAI
jgi:hypothetical protein